METLQSFLDIKLMLSVGVGLGLGAALIFLGVKLFDLLGDARDAWESRRYWAKERAREKAEAAKAEAERTFALEEKVAALQQHIFCREGCGCKE